MDHKESDQILMDSMRIYHNYVRKHQGLDGRTPAEAAGIKIKGDNKLLSLIKAASKSD